MQKKTSLRLRNTRRNSIPLHLDLLESRLLLSSTHAAILLPHAHPATPTSNTAPSKLKVALSPHILDIDTSTSLTGTFADPDAADTHTVSIDWGDGSQLFTTSLAAGITDIPAASHTYFSDGVFTITTTVTDSANNSTSTTSQVAVADHSDILPTVTKAPKLVDTVIAGNALSGSVFVNVANIGTHKSNTAFISAFLRPISGADINITPTAFRIPPLSGIALVDGTIKHPFKSAPVKVSLPLTIPSGTYTLVIVVSDGTPIGSAAQLNNTVVDNAFTLTATAGAATITPTLDISKLPANITQGASASGSIAVTFTNSGNIPTINNAAAYNITLALHPTSGPDVTLITENDVTLPTINPDGSFKITAPIALSAIATAAVPPGTYTFIATLTPVDPITQAPIVGATPIIIAPTTPTLTITAASNTGGTGLLKHGDTVNFTGNTQLNGQNFLERGFFTTNVKHISGTYEFTPTGLVLTYSNGDTDTLAVTLTGSQTFFDPIITNGDPTTVIFSTDPTGSFASILATGSSTPFFAKDA